MSDYYQRSNIFSITGAKRFAQPEDDANEQLVAAVLSREWHCEFHKYKGEYQRIDWWIEQNEDFVMLAELKSRAHDFDTYPTVFLNVRKWLALTLASLGLGVPAIYAVKFLDRIAWMPLTSIDAEHNRVGGCKRIVKSSNDREPMIEIPLDDWRTLRDENGKPITA
jgi:hypothetical protein